MEIGGFDGMMKHLQSIQDVVKDKKSEDCDVYKELRRAEFQ